MIPSGWRDPASQSGAAGPNTERDDGGGLIPSPSLYLPSSIFAHVLLSPHRLRSGSEVDRTSHRR
jgi:hypothetical protein